MAESLKVKATDSMSALSARDKLLLDAFISGTSRKLLSEQFGISLQRVSQILHQPASVAYMLQNANAAKTHVYARITAEILSRTEWGGLRMSDLISLWKVAMPQEMTVRVEQAEIEAAAERLADQTGIPKERAIVDIRERLKGTG